jgi:hypothetical protein
MDRDEDDMLLFPPLMAGLQSCLNASICVGALLALRRASYCFFTPRSFHRLLVACDNQAGRANATKSELLASLL